MTTPDEYRAVFRNLASGVTVVTTLHQGKMFGMTATSFTSVSLEPMLVQVSLAKDARTHDAVQAAGVFAANILAADQEAIARDFATPNKDRATIASTKPGKVGLPLVEGAIGHFECRVTDMVDGGDHTIFVAEVLQSAIRGGDPLVYFHGGYTTIEHTQ